MEPCSASGKGLVDGWNMLDDVVEDNDVEHLAFLKRLGEIPRAHRQAARGGGGLNHRVRFDTENSEMTPRLFEEPPMCRTDVKQGLPRLRWLQIKNQLHDLTEILHADGLEPGFPSPLIHSAMYLPIIDNRLKNASLVAATGANEVPGLDARHDGTRADNTGAWYGG